MRGASGPEALSPSCKPAPSGFACADESRDACRTRDLMPKIASHAFFGPTANAFCLILAFITLHAMSACQNIFCSIHSSWHVVLNCINVKPLSSHEASHMPAPVVLMDKAHSLPFSRCLMNIHPNIWRVPF